MTSPSRRTFLATSAATATGAALAGIVPNAHARGAQLLKVGLIGCGGRGTGAIENICEAAGTSYPISIHALGDVFEDRLKGCLEASKSNEKCKGKMDVTPERCFTGFDNYKGVIESCDLIMLATPPGFRPQHIEAVVKAGKHLFTEKPVAVDGPGIRKVLAAAKEAKDKNLGIVAGTQRRHQAGYINNIVRIQEGAIGDLVSGRVFWNQGNIWANQRQDGWDDMTYQLRNWYHYTWLCGDCIVEQHVHNLDVALWALGTLPVRAVGMGGQEVNTASEYGESFDHFAVDFEFPNGVHIQSMARQIANCESEVAEHLVGTKGKWHSSGYRFEGVEIPRFREREVNPYVQEHIDLLASIESSKPLNELEQVANSTLTAIMGRLSAYTGKAVTWDQALNSQWNTFPETLAFGPRPPIQIAKPGVTELV